MNTEINKSAKCFGAYDGDKIVGFYAVIHFPHPNDPKMKRVHREVVLPDYQGIGIGMGLNNAEGEYYSKHGYTFFTTTSAKNLISAMNRSPHWKCIRIGHTSKDGNGAVITGTHRSKVKTASFIYQTESSVNN